jgi:putative nucleotidyltransferase-like protein
VRGVSKVGPGDAERRTGAAGWSALLGGRIEASGADRRLLAAWAERIADLLSPALAEHLLGPAQERTGPLIDPERAAKGRLYATFLYQRQIDAVRLLQGRGIRFVCLKGFALAHQIYALPQARIVGDVDLLVDPADLDRATGALAAAGFTAMPIPSRFGFISEASFLPIVSPDRQVAIDLHVAPDAWPAARALTAAAVFAWAVPFRAGGLDLLGPAPEHAFFLLLTNIAKDRFGPEGVRKALDAALLLRAGVAFDWELVGALVASGGYARALAAFLRLLQRLGAETGAPHAHRAPIRARVEREVERVADLYVTAQVPRLDFYDKLRRELLLGPDPLSVAQINLRRLIGLVHPGTGLPPGMPERRQPRRPLENP